MTAQPIARVLVCTRNGRQALSLPFLKKSITSDALVFHAYKVYTLAAAVDGIWKGDMIVCFVCVKGTDYAAAVEVYGQIF